MNLRLRITSAIALSTLVVALVPGAATASPGAQTQSLQSKLLKLDQLPAGWTSSRPAQGGIGCLVNPIEPKGTRGTAESERQFFSGQGVPTLDERLALFRNPAAALRQIVNQLESCKRLDGYVEGEHLVGSIKPAPFGRDDTVSAAFEATFGGQGQRYSDDLEVERQGNLILGIDEAETAPIDPHQFEGFVSSAVSDLR
jgi:hypothetical protein